MIRCPYCPHTMSVKGAKAGRFKPKCGKCGRQFQLTVTGDTDLSFQSEPLPGDSQAKSAAFDPNATAPSVVESPPRRPAKLEPTVVTGHGKVEDAEFSVSASAAKSGPVDDATMADDPIRRSAANLESTEAERGAATEEGERDPIPELLGGYQVVKELGRGGMGAVYLARQVSLDRPVALKVMNTEWASNPNFLVRFTREAYAAAQLVHHNVVQVYDIGADQGINYFSMEFVDGRSLGDLLKKHGRVPAEAAAGYALQAARGLKFAHDRGMIHRDIKPDNLMLNEHGVVKVADMGLVRTPGLVEDAPDEEKRASDEKALREKATTGRTLASLSGVTMVGQAMGTPSYMAPEQARDATTCDHRADIYSLGCTIYVLVTGRPVFAGANALEVMTAHASETPKPPSAVNKEVPKALSDIVMKMIAKKPEDRFQGMDEVVKVLEDFLGLHAADQQAATEQHLRTLEQGVKAFHGVGLASIRSLSLMGFFGGALLLAAIFLFSGWWRVAGFCAGLGVMTIASYACVRGSMERAYLFRRVRDWLGGCSWVDWAKMGGGVLLALLLLYFMGLLGVVLLSALMGTGLAFGIHYGLDRTITAERAKATDKVEKMLKTLRLRGLSEEALQEFVAKYSGENWEEFFEALFGYESKLAARVKYGTGPKGPRPKFGGWRDSVVRWLDTAQKARQEAKEKAHLRQVEQKGLEAQGMSSGEAKERAARVAEAIVEKAAEIKKQDAEPDVTVAPDQGRSMEKAPPPKRVNVHDLFQVADAPKLPPAPRKPLIEPLLKTLFGSTMRFGLGAFLMVVSLLWLNSNNLLPSSNDLDSAGTYTRIWQEYPRAQPFVLPMVPEVVLRMLCSLGALAAGFLLVTSALFGSWKIGFLQMAATAVFLVGRVPDLVPAVGPMSGEVVSLAAGGAITLLGFLFGRDVGDGN